MSPGFSTESYSVFAQIGLRENPGKNLNQKQVESFKLRSRKQSDGRGSNSGGPSRLRGSTIPQAWQHMEKSKDKMKDLVEAFTFAGIPLHVFRNQRFRDWLELHLSFYIYTLGSRIASLSRLSLKIADECIAAVKAALTKTPTRRDRLLDCLKEAGTFFLPPVPVITRH
ncbi:hypothetical protein ANN_19341 [Periplaneta americana]|uniref:Uncharacterized protein n=1 Tax=Periplaneta americana TaxID=6978 RepID=A0ABQ8S9T4_PERAM|nr:hypothetical protein ANN_19341 [Periplaneta americana]